MSRTYRSGFFIESEGHESTYDSKRDKKKVYKINKKCKRLTNKLFRLKEKYYIKNNNDIFLDLNKFRLSKHF